ncbi:DUF3570 domain-containing protein [Methylomagnum sp.]
MLKWLARSFAAFGPGLRQAGQRFFGSRRPHAAGPARVVGPLPPGPENSALRALTAAALALPGLAQTPAHAAEGDEASFQYGHYKEGARDIYGARSAYDPIRVDNLSGGGRFTLFDRWKFAFNYIQDTWSGATPITSAPNALGGNNYPGNSATITGATPLIAGNGTLMYDRQFNPYRLDLETGEYVKDRRLVQTIATASPETRQQGDFKITHEWDEAAVDVGGGLSEERDYHSAFASLAGRVDFNQKLTTLNLGLSYTNSDITARLDPNASPYYDYSNYRRQIDVTPGPNGTDSRLLNGTRQDWATRFGLTQVLTKHSLLESGVGYTRSTGYLANPYKVVDFIFVDPNQTPVDMGIPGVPALLTPEVQAVLEKRPDVRNQVTWDARYVHYIDGLDAAVHLGYRFYHDDWDINAHTFDADWVQPLGGGWTITPRFRYYSQGAADFYQSYFLFKQAQPKLGVGQIDLSKVPLDAYSSDYRLSGFGALSGGVTVSKKLGKAVTLEGSFEYYTHAGGLKLGGGGEGKYADFDYYQFNAGLKVDLSAPFQSGGDDPHAHHHHAGHSGGPAPAGIMFGHMLDKAGDVMVGYRYMYSLQSRSMLHGPNNAADPAIIARGCGAGKCSYALSEMSMQMHMLDLMYAPTDWLNLMLMPQFMDMDMKFRVPTGAPPPTGVSHSHGGALGHSTGGVGDIGLYALFKLLDAPGHHAHATLGFMAPSGDAGLKMPTSQTFYDYGMQLGSGTWDFRPSLTYTGHADDWSWGAQVSGVKRLETHNAYGYALGDMFQSTAWGGYNVLDWLSASVRGVYTAQGKVDGQYKASASYSGTMDFPANYGGHYWDVGFGLNATVAEGAFQGNQLGVEWLQPVLDDVHGYQVERKGSLYATWSLMF